MESGLWDEIKHRVIGYPLVLGKLIWYLIRVLYHFLKAIWTGEVFPLRPEKKITDHGRVVGYLDGERFVFTGRKMALPFVLLFAGVRMWDLVGLLFLAIITTQMLAWAGIIAPPAEGFINIFWVALGCLALGVMVQIHSVFVKHQTVGLWDILRLLNLNRAGSKVDTTQQLYRDDDTLAVKVRKGAEEFAGKIGRKE